MYNHLTTTPQPPPHRGAARQMYGSGSLRPPGTNPIINNQRTPANKQPTPLPHPIQRIPVARYPSIPYSIHEFDRYPDIYPLIFKYLTPKVGLPPPSRTGTHTRTRVGSGVHPPIDAVVGHSWKYMRNPEIEIGDGGPCGRGCAEGEFLCAKNCICIKNILRFVIIDSKNLEKSPKTTFAQM